MSLFISLYHNLEYEVTSNNFTFSLALQNLLFQGWNHMQSQNPAKPCVSALNDDRSRESGPEYIMTLYLILVDKAMDTQLRKRA